MNERLDARKYHKERKRARNSKKNLQKKERVEYFQVSSSFFSVMLSLILHSRTRRLDVFQYNIFDLKSSNHQTICFHATLNFY